MKNKAAQEMVARRNKIYGKKWRVENAKKAGKISVMNRKKRKLESSHSGSFTNTPTT